MYTKDKNWNRFIYANLMLGLTLYFIAISKFQETWLFHGFYFAVSFLLIVLLFYKYKKESLYFFMSDMRFIFLFSYFITYVLGSAILIFGSEVEILTKMDEYYIDSNEATFVDAINCLGLSVAVFFATIMNPKYWAAKVGRMCSKSININIDYVIFICIIIGLTFSLYVAYFDANDNNEVLPGVFRQLRFLLYIGAFLGILYSKKIASFNIIISILGCLIASIIGLLAFNKTDIILPLIVLTGSFSIRNNSKINLLTSIIGMFIIISIIGGSVLYARSSLLKLDFFDLTGRLSLLSDGISNEKFLDDYKKYSSWGRISLINAQAAAVKFYDQGDGGKDNINLFWALVPRILYPNKPIISNTGSDFYNKLTGNFGSSTAQGIFINGYYNIGLIGLLLYSSICGLIISQLSSISKIIVEQRSYALYPILLLGIQISSNTGGILATDFIGLFATFIVIIFIYKYIIDIFVNL